MGVLCTRENKVRKTSEKESKKEPKKESEKEGINNPKNNKTGSSQKRRGQKSFVGKSNGKNAGDIKLIKENNNNYSKFDLKKNYYLICPVCHEYIPKIETINYDQKKNDFVIISKCQCNTKSSKNSLNNFIDTKKSLNIDIKQMKQFLDILMEEVKAKGDEFEGFELIKKINNAFLKESKLCDTSTPLFYKCDKTLTSEERILSLIKLKYNLILAGTEKGKISIWNFESEYIIKEIEVKGKVLCLLEFEEYFILAGTSENDIALWNINDNNCKYKFKGHNGWVNSLAKCNEKIFASASNDKTIRIWNYKEKIIMLTLNTDFSVLSLIKLKDGSLCSSEDDELIKIWNWENGECIYNLIGHQKRVRSICQLEDGNIISGDDDRRIIIWKNNNIFKILLEGHTNSIRTLCQIDDNHFASGSIDNTIKIWDYKTYKCVQTLESKDGGHSSNITNIIKLKNNMFASSSCDKTIKIWKK